MYRSFWPSHWLSLLCFACWLLDWLLASCKSGAFQSPRRRKASFLQEALASGRVGPEELIMPCFLDYYMKKGVCRSRCVGSLLQIKSISYPSLLPTSKIWELFNTVRYHFITITHYSTENQQSTTITTTTNRLHTNLSLLKIIALED